MSMLSQRDSNRQTAQQYLHDYQGDSQLFPVLFEELIYPLFSKCMSLQKEHLADYRIAIVIEAYQRIMRGIYLTSSLSLSSLIIIDIIDIDIFFIHG